jgi:hypothetical protein
MMPPHTTAAPRREGDLLVIQGYSLGYTELDEELQILDANGQTVPFEVELDTVREDRSGGAANPPPGSIQRRNVLTVRLGVPQGGAPITVRFLGDEWGL